MVLPTLVPSSPQVCQQAHTAQGYGEDTLARPLRCTSQGDDAVGELVPRRHKALQQLQVKACDYGETVFALSQYDYV